MQQVDLTDLLNKPFKDRGRGPDSYDCLGLVIEVFRRYGIPFPDYDISAMACELVSSTIDAELKTLSDQWQEIKKPEIPCLIVIKADPIFTQHLGVVIGRDRFIHSSVINSKDRAVKIDRMSNIMVRNRIRGYYKYVQK